LITGSQKKNGSKSFVFLLPESSIKHLLFTAQKNQKKQFLAKQGIVLHKTGINKKHILLPKHNIFKLF